MISKVDLLFYLNIEVFRILHNRLRDSGDLVSKSLKLYADNETVNKSLSSGLSELSSTLCAIEEYRNAQAQRLEVKVQLIQFMKFVRKLSKYVLFFSDSAIYYD